MIVEDFEFENPFRDVPDDADPETIRNALWAELVNASPGQCYKVCRVFFPGCGEHITAPVRCSQTESAEFSLIRRHLALIVDDTRYSFIAEGPAGSCYFYLSKESVCE